VIVDKLEKLPRDKVEQELAALGVSGDATDGEPWPGNTVRYSLVCVLLVHAVLACVCTWKPLLLGR
jgi:hypothetical protein